MVPPWLVNGFVEWFYLPFILPGDFLVLMTFIFLSAAVVAMLSAAPWPFFQLPLVADLIRPKIINILSTSGARGILIGVGLGTLLTGLRVLMGADRPYGGK